MKILSMIAAATMLVSVSSVAHAADMGVVDINEPTVMTDPGFDWDGIYAGLKAGGSYITAPINISLGEGSFVLGANGTVNSVLFGVEGWAGGFVGGGAANFQVGAEGRIGYLVTPDMVLYGSGSVKHLFTAGPGVTFAGVGAGVEMALTDHVSIDGSYTFYPWNRTPGTFNMHNVSVSLNYHF